MMDTKESWSLIATLAAGVIAPAFFWWVGGVHAAGVAITGLAAAAYLLAHHWRLEELGRKCVWGALLTGILALAFVTAGFISATVAGFIAPPLMLILCVTVWMLGATAYVRSWDTRPRDPRSPDYDPQNHP